MNSDKPRGRRPAAANSRLACRDRLRRLHRHPRSRPDGTARRASAPECARAPCDRLLHAADARSGCRSRSPHRRRGACAVNFDESIRLSAVGADCAARAGRVADAGDVEDRRPGAAYRARRIRARSTSTTPSPSATSAARRCSSSPSRIPSRACMFYTLDQKPQARPLFERRRGCLSCHQAYSTLHVPGMLARSVFMAPDGLPLSQFGSYDPDDRTPFRQRWGGWYVTGTHGSMRHMGNAIVHEHRESRADDLRQTLNRTSLDGAVRGRGYLSAAQRHRGADGVSAPGAHDEPDHARRLGGAASPRTRAGRISPAVALRDAVNELVDYLLFVDEEPLTAAIKGHDALCGDVCRAGAGRQPRPIVAATRSRTPAAALSVQLHDLLGGISRAAGRGARGDLRPHVGRFCQDATRSPKYARLSDADRRAVVEILRETLPDLPADFRSASAMQIAPQRVDGTRRFNSSSQFWTTTMLAGRRSTDRCRPA